MVRSEKLKKKKSFFCRILKWIGLIFLFLILVFILILIFFKDQIKEFVFKEVSKSLKVEVKFKDFDFIIFSIFFNFVVQFDGILVIGKEGEYKGVKFVEIGNIEVYVGLWDVIGGDKIIVDEVYISDVIFDVCVDIVGVVNYDIVKLEEE